LERIRKEQKIFRLIDAFRIVLQDALETFNGGLVAASAAVVACDQILVLRQMSVRFHQFLMRQIGVLPLRIVVNYLSEFFNGLVGIGLIAIRIFHHLGVAHSDLKLRVFGLGAEGKEADEILIFLDAQKIICAASFAIIAVRYA